MILKNPLSLAVAILIYALWNSYDLFAAWAGAPLERYSSIIFLIWLTPLFWYWIFSKRNEKGYYQSALLWAAVGLSLAGEIASFNFIKYWGLTCALAAFAPFDRTLLFWFLSAIAWMPILGWLGSYYFPDFLQIIRFLVVIVSLGYWGIDARNKYYPQT